MSERDHLEEALSILGAHCGPPHYTLPYLPFIATAQHLTALAAHVTSVLSRAVVELVRLHAQAHDCRGGCATQACVNDVQHLIWQLNPGEPQAACAGCSMSMPVEDRFGRLVHVDAFSRPPAYFDCTLQEKP